MSDGESRVGIVTGAASGIGRATASAAAGAGARLVLADASEDALQNFASELSADGAQVVAVPGDVTDERHLEAVLAAADELGPLDFAVNVPGAWVIGDVADTDVDEWRRAIDITLTGCFLSMKHELRAFRRHGRPGAIVNIAASIGANVAMPGNASYSAGKAAVVMLAKCAALEAAPAGVRVNVVAPGGTDTPATATMDTEMRAAIVSQHPLGRFAAADEIVNGALWLCSDSASFVTGTVLTIDGGYAAHCR
ncbi:MAG TPA: SDR family NAD(P)-dependent oxidoreductase [Solirubrobacteraceae bacterium]|nr:SDR family NAD(P)-dependent oxidoreductase [Solirubrobacteraceae bacterium]